MVMGRGLKKVAVVIGVIGVLAGLFTLSGYLLPRDVKLETSMDIDASAERVFWYFDTQAGIQAWWTAVGEAQPQADMPPMQVRALPGPKAGVGAQIDFAMGEEVTEHWVVLESTAPTTVVYEVDYLAFAVRRSILIESVDADTSRVRWIETTDLSNPLMRWMFYVEGGESIVSNFRGALAGVKRLAESPKPGT